MNHKKGCPQGRLGHKGANETKYSHFTTTEVLGQRILEALFIGPLTTSEAHKLGIKELGAGVKALRESGYQIDKVWVTAHTPDGKPHKTARYILRD